MPEALEYPKMQTPAEQCEPGSTEWARSLTYRVQREMEKTDKYAVDRIITCLRQLFADDVPLPWEVLPTAKNPWRSPAPWMEHTFNTQWEAMSLIIRKKEPELEARISARLNPGREANNSAGSNQHVKQGGQVNNVNLASLPKGNSRAYALNRLEREAPELFERVVAGELSANAAAIKAGFRKVQTPMEAARKAIAKLTPDEKRELLEELSSCLS